MAVRHPRGGRLFKAHAFGSSPQPSWVRRGGWARLDAWPGAAAQGPWEGGGKGPKGLEGWTRRGLVSSRNWRRGGTKGGDKQDPPSPFGKWLGGEQARGVHLPTELAGGGEGRLLGRRFVAAGFKQEARGGRGPESSRAQDMDTALCSAVSTWGTAPGGRPWQPLASQPPVWTCTRPRLCGAFGPVGPGGHPTCRWLSVLRGPCWIAACKCSVSSGG